MQNICKIYAKCMPNICQIYAKLNYASLSVAGFTKLVFFSSFVFVSPLRHFSRSRPLRWVTGIAAGSPGSLGAAPAIPEQRLFQRGQPGPPPFQYRHIVPILKYIALSPPSRIRVPNKTFPGSRRWIQATGEKMGSLQCTMLEKCSVKLTKKRTLLGRISLQENLTHMCEVL